MNFETVMIKPFWVELIALFILALLTFAAARKRSLYPIHMLQLEGYKTEEYLKWVKTNSQKVQKFFYREHNEKTPLVITERVQRLRNSVAFLNICLLTSGFLIRIGLGNASLFLDVLTALYYFLIYYFQYYVVKWANDMNYEKEESINRGFYVIAQRKIRTMKEQNGLKVIGITGSFGKTSTKFITSTILEEAFNVQNTPSSYNTPMGLSKIINNDLTIEKQIFIAELGAKEPGEIQEVAELVQPSIGVITAIGPTHMHLFKNINNIQRTKYELIHSLREDGIAIFNYDNEYVQPLADQTTKYRKIIYGVEDIENRDVYAKDITVGERGSTFTLGVKDLGEIECHTKLLGAHNISNILAGASIGYALGMDLESIARGIRKVEPVDHRLNLIEGAGGVTIIDDAFNSNPAGARAALEVLKNFKNGKKIMVTPGMVELGDMEEEENYKLGLEMAKVVDYALLVGRKRTEPIQRGLREAGFPEERMIISSSLNDATEELGKITTRGDVVLFENDLPDNYDEA